MKNFIFISFVTSKIQSKKFLNEDKFPAFQTVVFIHNLIESIEKFKEINLDHLSSRPVSSFPIYPKIFIQYKKVIEEFDNLSINITEMPFINLGLLRLITRFFSSFIIAFKKMLFKKRNGVIVYSIHLPFMLTGYILSRLFKTEFICIWGDPPTILRQSKVSFLSLRKFELLILKYLMKKADKVIVASEYLATDFAPKSKRLIIEGIVKFPKIHKELKNENNVVSVVYTGTISKLYGMENIVKAFIMANDLSLNLDVYGVGDYVPELIRLSKIYPFIKYHGYVNHELSVIAQKKADFLIIARSIQDQYTKYSFPSKLLEYMASGTPTITTKLIGIPSEYFRHLITLNDNSVATISNKLLEIKKMTLSERLDLGLSAINFLKKRNSISVVGKKINDFLLR